ncbi:MAG: hypothetical protein H8E57_01850 [Candidatus Cloacimonetes bacterium]|nr:hypothetical protein [Candidatus Cloacimonadota bacterium]
MSKFVETQTRKIIGSYGGVGSIIETPIGALKIEHFDKWSFYKKQEHLNSEHHIEDDRLLNRLRFEKGFPRLKAFVKVPTNVAHFKNKTIPQNFTDVISAKFYLTECRNTSASIIFPFEEQYSQNTSKGIARIWKYTVELPPL